MPRPRGKRHILFSAEVTYFKPQGIPLRQLETVEISAEELEVLRLKHITKYSQEECAQKMKTSQSTIQRLLSSGMQKVSEALTSGKAIRIEKPNQ